MRLRLCASVYSRCASSGYVWSFRSIRQFKRRQIMSWEHFESPVVCKDCGNKGSHIYSENDWLQTRLIWIDFNFIEVPTKKRHTGSISCEKRGSSSIQINKDEAQYVRPNNLVLSVKVIDSHSIWEGAGTYHISILRTKYAKKLLHHLVKTNLTNSTIWGRST